MGFLEREGSKHNSRPIEYYEFEVAGEFYRYNPSKVDKTLNGNTYFSDTVIRTNYKQNKDSVADISMFIDVRREFPIALLFKIIVPSKTVWLTVYRNHVGEPDSEARVIWVGRVRGCEWSSVGAKFTCEPIGTMVKRAGLRMNYQTGCNHFHYGPSCGVDKASYRSIGSINSIVGANVYSNVFAQAPAQYYRLGIVEMNNIKK